MTDIILHPIAYVSNSRLTLDDDNWGDVTSEITLDESLPAESLDGLETFSHIEILFYFDQVVEGKIIMSRHPRGNMD